MSFALYLEFAHSLQSFEFIKKEKLSRQEINFHCLFLKTIKQEKQTKKPQELV